MNFQIIDAYGSVITIASSTVGGVEYQQIGVSIIGALTTTPAGNQSVSGTIGASTIGTVPTTQAGTWISSIVNTVPSSVIVGASIFGQLPAGTAPIGSVAVLQGTAPWLISSVYGNIAGSVVAIQSGTTISSIVNSIPSSVLVGNYAQRNDAVASFLGGNLTWNPLATDSAGRNLIKPFSSEDGTIISYQSSLVSTSVTLIQASVIGQRSYITDFWLSNSGTANPIITFQDGSTSILGNFMVPTLGGSNSPGIAIPLKTNVSQDLAWKVGTASSVVYLTLKGYQAP